MRKKLIKKAINIVSYILIAVLFAAVLFIVYCNTTNKIAYIGGRSAVKIISVSMYPTIPTDTYILVKQVDTAKLETGDVIIFYSKDPTIYGKLNTHRIVEIEETDAGRVFTTQGDNNTLKDHYKVNEADVVGQYVKNLGTLTAVAGFISKPLVFILVILLPALVLLCFAAMDFVKSMKAIKHERLVEREIERLKQEQDKPEEE